MRHATDRARAHGARAADLKNGLGGPPSLLAIGATVEPSRRVGVGLARTPPERVGAGGQEILAAIIHRGPHLAPLGPPALGTPPARKGKGEVEADNRARLARGERDQPRDEPLTVQAVAQIHQLAIGDLGEPDRLLRARDPARPVDREDMHERNCRRC